ncbi:hypothetical protein SPHINGO8BC_90541 [Sphingobacterium multivorum]|uniref:Uncharacterized protein n=1 Tax=Sphingobacterium multivorum TaxID=28454 RepID=A0A654DTA0_SPHMU|nr:hypothetical protein SPHINGO8BC_90541 [Sphingobacterium multivorum]
MDHGLRLAPVSSLAMGPISPIALVSVGRRSEEKLRQVLLGYEGDTK